MDDCVDCTTNALTLFNDLLNRKNRKIWVKKDDKTNIRPVIKEVRIHMVEKNNSYHECTVKTDVENNDYPLSGKFTLETPDGNPFVTIIFNCSEKNDDIVVNGYKVISLTRREGRQSKYLLKYDEKIKLGPKM